MKIVIFMSGLRMGGAERVAISLSNYLSRNNVDIYLVSFDSEKPSYEISDKVNFIYFKNDNYGKITSIINRVKFVIKTFKNINPNLIFTMNYKMSLYSFLYKWFCNKNVRVVSSERAHPNSSDRKGISKVLNIYASKKCDGFIFQTERVRKFYGKKVQNHSIVIHNPVSNPLLDKIDSQVVRSEKTITSMGRLENQKAQDIMIKAFAIVHKIYPDYKLVIYGEGTKRQYLETLIKELSLENSVLLPGNDSKAILKVAKSQVFLLTSVYEGMPNALLEAMAAGIPCISTDCEMGPSELINDGVNGYLVDLGDYKKISEIIIKLLEDKRLSDRISKECKKILETHSIDYIFSEYLNYFKYVMIKKKSFKERLFRALSRRGYLDFLSDELYLKVMYYSIIGSSLNLNNPQTFNEKLQWLKLNDRKDIYTNLVDKIEAKKIVADIIGQEYVIPTLAVYDKFDDIDFNNLPNRFVIKCSHDSGGVVICKDKKTFNREKAKKLIEKHLNKNFYYIGREWPYKNVKPRILIEKFMQDDKSEDLNDYKFMCFNGKVKCSFVCSERRSKTGLKVTFYDLKWKKMPFERHYPSSITDIDKPLNHEKMIELAEKLARDIIFARIDFYEINGKIYFGEITFFPGNGTEEFNPVEYDYKLGRWIQISNDKES